MVLLKRASSLGHPQARACLGLGKRVLLHSLVDGDAEFLDDSPDRASTPHHASSHNTNSHSAHLRLAVSPLQPPSRPNPHRSATSSSSHWSSGAGSDAPHLPGHYPRRRRSGGTELNGRVGVATAFEETTGRLVVQLVQPPGDDGHFPGSKLAVRAANVRMER